MTLISRYAKEIEAVSVAVTATVAIAALIGVKVQLDTAERLQKEQSAREIYREFLSLSIKHPNFADPDYCAITDSADAPAYAAYMEYMLYTAEQVVGITPDWAPVFEDTLADHAPYFCSATDWTGYTVDVADLIEQVRASSCPVEITCTN